MLLRTTALALVLGTLADARPGTEAPARSAAPHAVSSVAPTSATRIAADSLPAWARWLEGRWGCTGAFASGRPIAADVAFAAELGNRWLAYRHMDRAPASYQAFALLGPLTPADTGRLVAVLHDNGGGQRRFTSAGWRDGALVLLRDSTEAGARPERFIWRRTSDSTYWFAWELRRTPGGPWTLGDSLGCRRTAGR
ncbi:MAG TPA: hypothetical protein VFS40_07115 [Gemmatimonadales bacterium]|nr:hypothetical protein [Gemmatimonadales bacterium]